MAVRMPGLLPGLTKPLPLKAPVMPVPERIAPLATWKALLAMLPLTTNSPALTVVGPEYVLTAAPSVSLPVPSLVRPTAPEPVPVEFPMAVL